MGQPRVIFFDVGNTLLFPNRKKVLAPLAASSHLTIEQWQGLERKTKLEFDREMGSGKVDHGFWWIFHNYLVKDFAAQSLPSLGARDQLVADLVRNTQISANWDQSLPGTVECLKQLSANFRIAVISNSDGKVDKLLGNCGLADLFESITDSGMIGIEKPDCRIFQAALRSMDATAEESLYVGDVYSVDYVGATMAGMQALLFDVCGAYRDRPEARIESLEQLETWLNRFTTLTSRS